MSRQSPTTGTSSQQWYATGIKGWLLWQTGGSMNLPSYLFFILAPKHFPLFLQRLYTKCHFHFLFVLLESFSCVETNKIQKLDYLFTIWIPAYFGIQIPTVFRCSKTFQFINSRSKFVEKCLFLVLFPSVHCHL